MHILIYNISFFPAHEGGPTNALYWLASGLAHCGIDVCVVTSKKGIKDSIVPFDQWTRLNGFDVIYIDKINYKNVCYQKMQQCDVIISSGVCAISDFLFCLKSVWLGKRVIISPRGELFDSAIDHKGKFYGFLKRRFFQFMKICYGKRVTYHATSVEEDAVVRKLMKTDKVFLAPNLMILPEKIKPVKESQPYFLYVGRINPIKALDKLIKGLALSNNFMQSNLVLKIAGGTGGTYHQELLNLANEFGVTGRVEFVGVKTGTDLAQLYAGAQWLFLVSESENFGNVVIEALCQGTPVVASKGTPWQNLEENKAGCWIDNSPESIAGKLNEILLMKDEEYQDYRQNAYRMSRQYDVYSNMDEWVKVLNDSSEK